MQLHNCPNSNAHNCNHGSCELLHLLSKKEETALFVLFALGLLLIILNVSIIRLVH